MKNTNIIKVTKFILASFLISFTLSQCTSSKKIVKLNSDEIKNMIDSSQFIFVAERVTPMRGSSRYLTSSYSVTLKKDSLECYLPYFGRAFQAPIDPSKGGIQFTSTDFSYRANAKNERQWDVNIKPNDNSEVQQLNFSIFDNATANLNVVSTNRDPITFNGHVEKIK